MAPTRTRRPSLGGFAALVGGLALVGAGLAVVITRNGDYSVSTAAIAWAVALGIVALALIIGGVLGRRSGIVTLFALVALIGTIGASIVPKADHTQLVGEGTWRPVTAAEASGGFALGIGHATLDLSDLAQTSLSVADPITVKATVGIGQLTVKVPEGISVLVRTSAGAGSLPQPQAVTVTTNSQNVHDGSQFAGNDDHGNLGGASIKRTVTVGAGAPSGDCRRQGWRRRDRHPAGDVVSDPSQPAYDAANQSRPEPEPTNGEPTVTAETTLIDPGDPRPTDPRLTTSRHRPAATGRRRRRH